MKPIVFLFVAAFAIVTSQMETNDEDYMIRGLSSMFNISRIDARTCIHQIKVTKADLQLLTDVILMKTVTEIDKSLRKASCTIACAANIQGTMSGTKIQVAEIQQQLPRFQIPQDIQEIMIDGINVCSDQVKQITDKCDVALHFVKCLAIQCSSFIGY